VTSVPSPGSSTIAPDSSSVTPHRARLCDDLRARSASASSRPPLETARSIRSCSSTRSTSRSGREGPIRYPNAIYDEDEQRWVSDAEVAEVGFTAFTGRRKAEHVTARLIVRRVRRLNPEHVPAGQTEAFAVYRYHAVFTDSPEPMLHAEATHRDHAIVEQVIAELKNGPLAPPVRGRQRRLMRG
jgi:hypothetical protein